MNQRQSRIPTNQRRYQAGEVRLLDGVVHQRRAWLRHLHVKTHLNIVPEVEMSGDFAGSEMFMAIFVPFCVQAMTPGIDRTLMAESGAKFTEICHRPDASPGP
jgi:hypothetical protein